MHASYTKVLTHYKSITTKMSTKESKRKTNHSGDIFIDNHNIKELDLKFLRRNIGLVSQEPSLFAGTIKDNIKVGKINADDEEIQHAALLANADSFISQLPDKYLTEVRHFSKKSAHLILILLLSSIPITQAQLHFPLMGDNN